MRLSICMIVRNEERDLPRCLASLTGVADEIVVVDTGSVDRTPQLAADAGARVLRAAWHRDFAAARNVSLQAATGDWILVLDADEEIPAVTRSALRAEADHAAALGLAGVALLMRNLSPPGEATTYTDLPVVRLFQRAPHIRYEGRIHEQVSSSIHRAGGLLGASDLHILHHGYARLGTQGDSTRAQRNLVLLDEAVRDAPDDAYLVYQLGATQKAIGAHEAAEVSLARALELQANTHALSSSAEADARMKLAQLALARGDDAIALEEAKGCLAVDPANVIALQMLIVAAITLEHLPDAALACRALLACPNVTDSVRADTAKLLQMLGG
jgi:tetratricopeptide (TPR) repeat protein